MVDYLSFHLRKPEKEEHIKSKVSSGKQIIKTRAEIGKTENRKSVEKIKKSENCIFEKYKYSIVVLYRGFLGTEGVRGVGKVRSRGVKRTEEIREVIDIFLILIVVMVSFVRTYQLVHFKCVLFILSRVYLNKAV